MSHLFSLLLSRRDHWTLVVPSLLHSSSRRRRRRRRWYYSYDSGTFEYTMYHICHFPMQPSHNRHSSRHSLKTHRKGIKYKKAYHSNWKRKGTNPLCLHRSCGIGFWKRYIRWTFLLVVQFQKRTKWFPSILDIVFQ